MNGQKAKRGPAYLGENTECRFFNFINLPRLFSKLSHSFVEF